jgi:hypothetical protein
MHMGVTTGADAARPFARQPILELLQTFGLGHVHPAVLGLPIVEHRFRDAVLARQVGRLRPGLRLAQYANDLLFREPCSLHLSVPVKAGL